MKWLGLAWIAPIVIGMGFGCGGTVQTNTTGTGGSGNSTANGGTGGVGGVAAGGAAVGGSSVGGSAVGGSAVGGSSVGGSSVGGGGMGGAGGMGQGGSGGSVCDEACGKAEQCGLPGGQCGQFVDCATMQGSCLADCINDPTVDCQDLFAALQGNPGPLTTCLQDCQGMGQGGAGGMGQGGGPSMDCQQCGQDQCQNAALQCFQQSGQAECQGWIECVGNCADATCFDDCTAMFPGGAVIGECACTSCAMACGAVCGGSSGQGGAGGGMGGAGGGMGGAGGMGQGGAGGGMGDPMACQQCGQQQCGTEIQQCFGAGFQQCQAWLNCSETCQDKACLDACSAANPVGTALGACICNDCAQTGCGYTCD